MTPSMEMFLLFALSFVWPADEKVSWKLDLKISQLHSNHLNIILFFAIMFKLIGNGFSITP